MRNAAGQRADGFELLRLTEAPLEPLAFGLGILAVADVLHRAGHARRPARGVADGDAALAVPVPRAAVMLQPVFDLEVRSPAAQMRRDRRANGGHVAGVVMRALDPVTPALLRLDRVKPQQ